MPLPPAPTVWDPTKRKTRGRPSIFVQRPEAWPRLIMALRDGNTLQASCQYAGIGKGVFNKMLRMGRSATSGPWRDFMIAVDNAYAEAEVLHVGNVARAGRLGTWKASAFLLAMRDPKRYAPTSRVALTDPTFDAPAVFEMRLPSVKPVAAKSAPADADDDEDDEMDR